MCHGVLHREAHPRMEVVGVVEGFAAQEGQMCPHPALEYPQMLIKWK